MKRLLAVGVLLALTMIGLGCGGSNSSTTLTGNQSANVFMTGEDAPLASVVGFKVTLNSVVLNGQGGSTASLISTPTTVDFARLLGLRSPLAFNSVPAGTYNSVTFVMANPLIAYVDMTQNPPALTTLNGTFPQNQNPYTLTVNFPSPMVVSSNGLAGLKMEMDIRQSVAVDGNGQITGAVNPVIYVKATRASDADGQVTDLMGGLVSVDAASYSFVLQGPYGRQLTVDVNSSTQFNGGWNINDLAVPAFVAVQGRFQADGTLLAAGVEVVTTAHSFVSGRVLQTTTNGSGQVQTITMFLGETGADMVNDVDTIQTFDVSALSNTDYEICFLSGPVLNAVFNDTSVVVGQRVFLGGNFSGGVFTPQMISLRLQGVYGMFVPGSVTVGSGNQGSFLLANNGLVGFSAGGPVTVNTFNFTGFFNLTGLNQLQTTSSAIPIVTRGLLLKDPVSGTPQMFVGWVATPSGN